jgi:hypothetical protein
MTAPRLRCSLVAACFLRVVTVSLVASWLISRNLRKQKRLTRRSVEAEIGIGLTGMGLLFTMLGVLLFFDGGLLAVGNVSVLGFEYL